MTSHIGASYRFSLLSHSPVFFDEKLFLTHSLLHAQIYRTLPALRSAIRLPSMSVAFSLLFRFVPIRKKWNKERRKFNALFMAHGIGTQHCLVDGFSGDSPRSTTILIKLFNYPQRVFLKFCTPFGAHETSETIFFPSENLFFRELNFPLRSCFLSNRENFLFFRLMRRTHRVNEHRREDEE